MWFRTRSPRQPVPDPPPCGDTLRELLGSATTYARLLARFPFEYRLLRPEHAPSLSVDIVTHLATGTPFVGWWQGWANVAEVGRSIESEGCRLTLVPASDLDFVIWTPTLNELRQATGILPFTIAFDQDFGWLYTSPPSSMVSTLGSDTALDELPSGVTLVRDHRRTNPGGTGA